MERKILDLCDRQLYHLKSLRDLETARAQELAGYEKIVLRTTRCGKSKKTYYRVLDGNGKMNYLGNASNAEVRKIKEAHFIDKSLMIINKDISLLENLLAHYSLTDHSEIAKLLPKTYRDEQVIRDTTYANIAAEWKAAKEAEKESFGSWYPEGLITTASDGTKVRTKSEAGLIEVVLRNSLVYVYELPVVLHNGKIAHPDLTILSAIDFKTEIRVEHEGSMDDPQYRNKHSWRLEHYWKSGYIPNVNLFFTYDSIDGGVDLESFQHIIDGWLKPHAAQIQLV